MTTVITTSATKKETKYIVDGEFYAIVDIVGNEICWMGNILAKRKQYYGKLTSSKAADNGAF